MQPADKALDNLLSNLNVQLANLSDPSFAPRNTCARCGKPILGALIEASAQKFHPEHFLCSVCNTSLHGQDYYEPGGAIHCVSCYHKKLPSCASCGGKISTKAITLDEIHKAWHPEHFACDVCKALLEGKDFYAHEGKVFCAKDYHNKFSVVCLGCNKQIQGELVTTSQKLHYHPACFLCNAPRCGKKLVGVPYYEHAGQVYCELHYRSTALKHCPCGNPILGQYVSALNKTWHPEHFVCGNCGKQLSTAYSENAGNVYCEECDTKLFG